MVNCFVLVLQQDKIDINYRVSCIVMMTLLPIYHAVVISGQIRYYIRILSFSGTDQVNSVG